MFAAIFKEHTDRNSLLSVSAMKSDKESAISGQSPKHRKARTRKVSSRFLSPTSTTSLEAESASSRDGLSPSPSRSKPGSNSTETRRHRSLEDPSLLRGQLWPSSSPTLKKNAGATLADHLSNDRFRELVDRRSNEKSAKDSSVFSLTKQRSCTVFSRFESDRFDQNTSSKENKIPVVIGGSTRYTGKIGFSGNSSSSSSSSNSNSNDSGIVPGRLSVDENTLYKKSLFTKQDSEFTLDSDSYYSNTRKGTNERSLMNPGKLSVVVPSRHMNDASRRHRRGTSESNIQNPSSSEDSSTLKKFTIKNAIRRANSLTGYKSSKSQWALSPGRSGSPPMSVESKEKHVSFSSLKPPTSPSKVKGVDKFLNMFKSKKSSNALTPTGLGISETVHQLRLFDNRLIQWRYANAKAEAVNRSIPNQAENKLLYAGDSITRMQLLVMQKKMQYEKEKLEMKLNFIIHSQIKILEKWGNLERQHVSAVTVIKDCLHSIVCRVPLIEGAEVDISSTSYASKHAYDLITSMKSMLTSFPPMAEEIATLLSELAEVVSQEKLLLEEFYELFQTISFLEFQERSLKCGLIQLQSWQQQYLQQ